MKKYFRLGFRQTVSIVPISVSFATLFVASAQAQVIPDATLVTPSVVNPIDALSNRVDGGVRQGGKLFHSFQRFDIDTGRSVFFGNPIGISNIFSRVTGTLPSNINGTLGVLGSANLFLINPKGIIFGKDAVLNIQGSFTATTATGVVFPNGERFTTTSPDVPTLLTVDVVAPIGIQFEGESIGDILSTGKLSSDKDLVLSGRTLNLQGEGSLSAKQKIQLAAQKDIKLGTDATITIETPEIIIQAGDSVVLGGLQNKTSAPPPPLSISIQSENDIKFINELKLYGGSIIAVSNQGDITSLGDLNTQFGTIKGGNVSLITKGSSLSKGSINIRNIVTQGGDITLKSDEGDIITKELNSGFTPLSGQAISGGRVEITALKGKISTSNIVSQSGTAVSAKNGGEIILNAYSDISTDRLESVSAVSYKDVISPQTSNGGQISLASKRGNITTGYIKSASYIDVDSTVKPQSSLYEDLLKVLPISVGNAGNVTLRAEQGSIFIKTNTSPGEQGVDNVINGSIEAYAYSFQRSLDGSTGRAGSVTVEAPNGSFVIEKGDPNNGLPKILAFSSDGTGGSVSINTRDNLILPYISTTGYGNTPTQKGSGSIKIDSEGNVTLADGLFITTDTFGAGNGGNISITSKSLSINDGGQISASTHANGSGGDIDLRANQFIQLSGVSTAKTSTELLFNNNGIAGIVPQGQYIGGYIPTGNPKEKTFPDGTLFPSGIFTQTTIGSKGNAGNISINSPQLIIQNRATIATTTFDTGESGSVTINTNGGSILLDNQGSIATGSGIDPSIPLDPMKRLPILSGDSRDINIQTRSLKILGKSSIKTLTVSTSNSGNIQIQSDFTLLRNNSQISTSSGIAGTLVDSGQRIGNGGNICINVDCPKKDDQRSFKEVISFNFANTQKRGFLVAPPSENSDITANAFNGRGGGVAINVLQIFGLKPRSRSELAILLDTNDPGKLNPENLLTSEITAISQENPSLNGEVIQPLNVDPIQGVNQPPIEPRNTEVADNCQVVSGRESVQFFDIGRGGIPPRPDDPLSLDLLDWMPSTQINPQANLSPSTDTKVDRVDIVFSDRASPSITTIRLRPPCQS